MRSLKQGKWLGIDVGSARKKVCSFCLIESDGRDNLLVSFEQGPATGTYPKTNTKKTLLNPLRAPTYLNEEIEQAVREVLEGAELIARLFSPTNGSQQAVAIDAPVALAADNDTSRLTEQASTQTFSTPNRKTFETQLSEKDDPFLRVNIFWKCIAFAIYRHLATRFEPQAVDLDQAAIAAWTCPGETSTWRMRETFPSDVYKRANGREGTLELAARDVLHNLVSPRVEWQTTGRKGCKPVKATLERLNTIRGFLHIDLEEGRSRLCEMRKRPGTHGDLWDAFTCAFTACCEAHEGAVFHGWNEDRETQRRIRSEGAILTVRSATPRSLG